MAPLKSCDSSTNSSMESSITANPYFSHGAMELGTQ